MLSLKRFRLIITLLVLSLSPSLFGQAVNATLLGTITDSSGATVAGGKVTATEVATGLIHESVSNECPINGRARGWAGAHESGHSWTSVVGYTHCE